MAFRRGFRRGRRRFKKRVAWVNQAFSGFDDSSEFDLSEPVHGGFNNRVFADFVLLQASSAATTAGGTLGLTANPTFAWEQMALPDLNIEAIRGEVVWTITPFIGGEPAQPHPRTRANAAPGNLRYDTLELYYGFHLIPVEIDQATPALAAADDWWTQVRSSAQKKNDLGRLFGVRRTWFNPQEFSQDQFGTADPIVNMAGPIATNPNLTGYGVGPNDFSAVDVKCKGVTLRKGFALALSFGILNLGDSNTTISNPLQFTVFPQLNVLVSRNSRRF